MRAAVYCRVSTENQQDNTSLDTQEERGRQYCAERGYEVVTVARETWTGADLNSRPELTRLRDMILSRGVDVIVSYAVDRLSRDQLHLAVLIYEAQDMKVRYEFVSETFEDNPIGRFILSARAFVAESERLSIIERSTRAKHSQARAGIYLKGFKPPYGYRWEGSTLVASEPEASTVRHIFDWIGRGHSIREIVGFLSDTPSPMGNPHWGRSTVWWLLRQPVYKGEPMALRQRAHKPRRSRLTQEAQWVPLPPCEALVTNDAWTAAQRVLERNRYARSGHQGGYQALLRGHVICGTCGGKAYVSPRGRDEGMAYRCGARLRPTGNCSRGGSMHVDVLDALIWEQAVRALQADLALENTKGKHKGVGELDKQIASLGRQLSRSVRLLLDLDDEAAHELQRQLNVIAQQKRALEEKRAEILADTPLSFEELRKRFPDAASALPFETKRVIIDSLKTRVTLWPRGSASRYEVAFG